MAIAGAVIGASFSTSSTGGLRYAQSEHHLAFTDLQLRIGSNGIRNLNRTAVRLPVLSVACRSDSVFAGVSLRQRALRRITAAVAQEEAVETAAEAEEAVETANEEETVKATKEEEEEEVGEEVAEEGGESLLNTKLYFGNLPYHCDSSQLAGIVQQYGNPELVEVLYNRETGKSRGFAFVTMSTIEDANAVIENLDGSEFAGRHLRVNFADKPRPKEPLYPETEYKLFVGNLSWSATSDSLYQIFQQCGEVVGARVLYDGETGRSRGYGFVCYGSRTEMENALANLNGTELEGRPMRVSMAQGKRS